MDQERPEQPDPEFVKISTERPQEEGDQPVAPRRFLEIMLDPRTLQGLMLVGGGLLVLGLVVWLWSIGVFENRLVVAGCLGAGNVALLVTGVAGYRFTRYQTAAKGITLLGCLVMPLNLWFYDAQGLVTLDQGGHLWIPALVCCAVYVLVARLLADPLFVHAIVGGITMTGMLFLADRQVGHLWEIVAPSTLLVVLGMICIHLERAFAVGKGPFSRDQFGREFFRAGHIVMSVGLGVLFVGRLCGRFYDPYLMNWGLLEMPAVATEAHLKLIALALTLCGAWSYLYSQLVVRPQGRYLTSAAITLLWNGVILLDVLAIPFTMSLLVLLTAASALAANAAAYFSKPKETATENSAGTPNWFAQLHSSAIPLGVGLNLATVALGLVLYGRARLEILNDLMPYEFGLPFFVATILCGISCWLGLKNAASNGAPHTASWHLRGLALILPLAVSQTLAFLGVPFSIATLTFEMALPLAIAIVSTVAKSEALQRACSRMAQLTAILLLVVGVGIALGLILATSVSQPNLWCALLFAEAAICFGFASVRVKQITPSILSALSFCAATWQLLLYLNVTQHVFLIALAVVGLVCLAVAEITTRLQKQNETAKFTTVCLWTGRMFVSFGGAATILMSFARLLTGETHWTIVGLLAAQAVASAAAAGLSRQSSWRRHFLVLTVGEILLSMLVINSLSTFSLLQRGELFLALVGLLVVAAGYLGWYREGETKQGQVSFNLAVGSMLSAIPLTLGLLVQRFSDSQADWGWIMLHEVGVLSIGMALLAAGILCRIRWSTLVGSCTLAVYLVSLVGLIHLPDQLQTTAITMMVGGGLFFGSAVLLSVYRDRLLAIPQKVKEGEGVFQVLKWR